MVDAVREKPPEMRGRPLPQGWSGRIRALQLKEEISLQTCCRCSGPSYTGQPQVAGSAIPQQTDPCVASLRLHTTRLGALQRDVLVRGGIRETRDLAEGRLAHPRPDA